MEEQSNDFDGFKNLSELYGRDRLLIQGAGGNTSLKDGSRMLVKASGKWLSDSKLDDIFVDVDLEKIRRSIEYGSNNPLQGAISNNEPLKPSIETTLHAVMPHKIVIHTHAVDIISIAVTKNARSKFFPLLSGLNWVWVDYAKPGLDLTRAVVDAMNGNRRDILVLGNHGLVVAGDDCAEVIELMETVQLRCRLNARSVDEKAHSAGVKFPFGCWELSPDEVINSLALDSQSYQIFKEGIIYPDQVVFLGNCPCFVGFGENSIEVIEAHNAEHGEYPVYYVHEGFGVYISELATNGLLSMLKCHGDVLLRIEGNQLINTLSVDKVAELMDWDAEKYRKVLDQSMRGI